MIKRLHSGFMVATVLMSLFYVTACSSDFKYVGDYPELYSVAIHSILGVRGFPPRPSQPSLRILDEDNYGRVMFFYNEGSYISPASIVIMQMVDGDYVYFYPHYNFFSDLSSALNESPNEISMSYLKQANSWNQAMSDVKEFVRVRIVRQPEPGPVMDEKLIVAYHDVFEGVELANRLNAVGLMVFLRADAYGRSVYLGVGAGQYWINTHKAFIFQPDHSFNLETGVLLITDRFDYQTDLRLFMETNGWDTPFNPSEA